MAARNVSFIAGTRQQQGEVGMVSVRMVSSAMPRLGHNELLTVLHRIRTARRQQDSWLAGCFDNYTFDFAMEAGFGFPYVLDFSLEDDATGDIA